MPDTVFPAHYISSLPKRRLVRWGAAALLARLAVWAFHSAAKCLPDQHPTRIYIEGRVEVTESHVIPSLSLGCPAWAKRLGQATAITVIVLACLFVVVGAAHSAHHVKHRQDKNVRPIDLFR